MTQSDPILQLIGVSKIFAGTQALRNVTISVRPGAVLCLLGDNGAGKSTLIKILSGVHPPSAGAMLVDGVETRFSSPREARAKGVATVHQDVGAIPLMSVTRNFFLGAEPTRGWGPFRLFDSSAAAVAALAAIREFGLTRVTDGEQLVGTLSGGERQALSIARAMYFGARVLILDEPTSALGVKEAAKVLSLVKAARTRGIGIVFITHNARHAMAIGDDFVVLNQGAVAASFRRGEKTREEVLDLMAGGDGSEPRPDLEDDA
ncbi:monosaccharide ABC transporter ATP-binding protein (CUT2 family) [Roseiarcus fermentans]|uniref:Monosaccharide ABC transporter ATP-binding protein (CUT2 family) n=1 Tax=Roseiarcus fermentans TaxID=1473586 RepID=A0A366F9D0_9HYPH|nr:ATP-binding cassette domain-containing protein [Roseiarcus fermentans]RBP10570.1 monosaccharide ABC transporter ATP-binding protein (CUT2 family) [Roseiarcus fermentans]